MSKLKEIRDRAKPDFPDVDYYAAVDESVLVKDCLSYLGTIGIWAWRQNTGAVKIGKRFVKFGTPGQGDISGMLPDGRRLEIETKRWPRRPTVNQLEFGSGVRKRNGVWHCVYSVSHLEWLLKHG